MEINEAMGLFKLKEQKIFGCEMAANQWVYLNWKNTNVWLWTIQIERTLI
jgi:hypothetical protein